MERNLGFFNRRALPAAASRAALVELPPGEGEPSSVTHGELDRRMEAVAGGLARAGLGPGDRLLVATGNGIAFVETIFGAMRLGVQLVPLNTALGAPTIAHVVRDARIAAVVADLDVAPRLLEVDLPRHRWALGGGVPGWRPCEVRATRFSGTSPTSTSGTPTWCSACHATSA